MKTVRSLLAAVVGLFAVSTSASDFADAVLSYSPGTGFASGFTNASVALGAPTIGVNPFTPAFRNTQLVSLGSGGSLTLQFFTPIRNDPGHPFGLDFLIFGNSGFIITNGNFSGGGITDGSLFGNNTGATRVSVSQDNRTYYQLNPLLAPNVDSLFPTDSTGDFHLTVKPTLTGVDFAGKGLAGIRSLYGGSNGGTGFDISWGQDLNGNSVLLDSISFIRIDVLSGKSEIDAIASVPEPSACVLILTAGLLMLCSRRMRTRASRWRCRDEAAAAACGIR
jgi:hypothetical protein